MQRNCEVPREIIRNDRSEIIGYLEEIPSTGRVKAMDRNYRTLGWYLPDRKITTDATWRVVSRGGNHLMRLFSCSK